MKEEVGDLMGTFVPVGEMHGYIVALHESGSNRLPCSTNATYLIQHM